IRRPRRDGRDDDMRCGCLRAGDGRQQSRQCKEWEAHAAIIARLPHLAPARALLHPHDDWRVRLTRPMHRRLERGIDGILTQRRTNADMAAPGGWKTPRGAAPATIRHTVTYFAASSLLCIAESAESTCGREPETKSLVNEQHQLSQRVLMRKICIPSTSKLKNLDVAMCDSPCLRSSSGRS